MEICALKEHLQSRKGQISDKLHLKKIPYLLKIIRNRAERAGNFNFKYKRVKRNYIVALHLYIDRVKKMCSFCTDRERRKKNDKKI